MYQFGDKVKVKVKDQKDFYKGSDVYVIDRVVSREGTEKESVKYRVIIPIANTGFYKEQTLTEGELE